MTTEEQRDYWEERYNIEAKKNKEIQDKIEDKNKDLKKRELENQILSEICRKSQELINKIFDIIDEQCVSKNKFEDLIKEMYKNGDMYWAGRIEKLL